MRRRSSFALAAVALATGACVFGAESGTSAGTADPLADDTTQGSTSDTGDATSGSPGVGSGDGSSGDTGVDAGGPTGDSMPPGDDSSGGCNPIPWFPDTDGDGAGDPAGPSVLSCDPVDGHAPNADDCDDGSMMVHPGLDEICDGIDNDCDVAVDEWSAVNEICGDCLAVPGAASVHYVCLAATSWAGAEAACELKGGSLVRIDGQPENDAITAAAAGQADGDYWIGLRWDGSDHVWTDGQAAAYTNWRPDAPDFSGQCGELDTLDAGQWNDVDCADTATAVGYICEGPLL